MDQTLMQQAADYKTLELQRQNQCGNKSKNEVEYSECLRQLGLNWQKFILKIEWERFKSNDCIKAMEKGQVQSQKMIDEACYQNMNKNIKNYIGQLKLDDQNIV